ncbi:hypothetical protein HMI54_011365, partial [Coelomomyces lativittatus]
ISYEKRIIPPVNTKEMIKAFQISNFSLIENESDNITYWRYKILFRNINWHRLDVNIITEELPLTELEMLLMHSNVKKICNKTYKKKCSIDFLMDIDKHLLGIEKTKLPFKNGRFLPFPKRKYHKVLKVIATIKTKYSILNQELRQILYKNLNLKESAQLNKKLDIFLFVFIHLWVIQNLLFLYKGLLYILIQMKKRFFQVPPFIKSLFAKSSKANMKKEVDSSLFKKPPNKLKSRPPQNQAINILGENLREDLLYFVFSRSEDMLDNIIFTTTEYSYAKQVVQILIQKNLSYKIFPIFKSGSMINEILRIYPLQDLNSRNRNNRRIIRPTREQNFQI